MMNLRRFGYLPLSLMLIVLFAPALTLAQPANFSTSLHKSRLGKDFWYSAANGGFEADTGVPIEQLGCVECHGPTDADGNPYPDPFPGASCNDCHQSSDFSVSQQQCYGCHGRQATEANSLGLPDVHRDAGMLCWDCHSTEDIHGDGTAYVSMLEPGAIDADCENCHNPTGMPLPEDHGNYDPHGGAIHCASCHASTVISCYNCHFESQVEAHLKRAKQPIKGFVMLVNRAKDGKVYPASFQSLTYQGKAFVAFGPFSPHTISAQGRGCPECHNMDGSNAAITQYNETGEIHFTTWDDVDKTLSVLPGIVPIPEDYEKRLKMDFITYDGQPTDPVGPSTNWSSIGKDTWDGHQLFFASPLNRDQMDILGFASFGASVDVKANGSDDWIVLPTSEPLSIDVSVDAGSDADKPADWFIVANTTWGWYFYNTKTGAWSPGLFPSLKNYGVVDVSPYNLLDANVLPGYYTFWFGVFTKDGGMALDTVSVYVTR